MGYATWRRELDWRLQNLLTVSAPVINRTLADPNKLLRSFTPPQRARYDLLNTRYALQAWPYACTRQEYWQNLYTLDICDHYFPRPRAMTRGLDIGAAAWSYLPALCAWSNTPWDGVELDAHRRYWTLATRRTHAEYMVRRSDPRCRYYSGSLLEMRECYSHMTWLLPFVTPEPLNAWHLPQRYFQPRELLAHAWSLLAPGGALFIVNQGEREYVAQGHLLEETGFSATPAGELTSVFSPYQQPRQAWLTHKPST